MRTLTAGLVLFLLSACGSAPGSGIGATCSVTQKCDGLSCDLSVPGGYCTKFCNTSGSTSECPDGSVCTRKMATRHSPRSYPLGIARDLATTARFALVSVSNSAQATHGAR